MLRPNQRWIPSPRASLLILLALVLLGCGAWTYGYARRRIAAVEYIRSHRGEVRFSTAPKWYPKWLPTPEWMLPVEYAHGAFDLARITAISELRALHLEGEIDDSRLQPVSRFYQLEVLHLGSSFDEDEIRITDAGMAPLAKCGKLNVLSVRSRLITDAALTPLAGLPLHDLDLGGSQITDDGLAVLARLPLRSLVLDGTHVTDRGLEHLVGLRLDTLWLDNTRVTDAGMHYLAKMPFMNLSLVGTSVGPEGASAFKDRDLWFLHLDASAGPIGAGYQRRD